MEIYLIQPELKKKDITIDLYANLIWFAVAGEPCIVWPQIFEDFTVQNEFIHTPPPPTPPKKKSRKIFHFWKFRYLLVTCTYRCSALLNNYSNGREINEFKINISYVTRQRLHTVSSFATPMHSVFPLETISFSFQQ